MFLRQDKSNCSVWLWHPPVLDVSYATMEVSDAQIYALVCFFNILNFPSSEVVPFVM